MVRTRSGHDVFHSEASYGRAARSESKRRMRKRKIAADLRDEDGVESSGTASTPVRNTRRTRGQIRQEEDLSTPPSAFARVGVTPPSQNERILRGGRLPTCSDYGNTRHYMFKGNGYFFCHPCDMWDSLPPDRSKNCSRTSKKFACIGKHTSFCHPTTYRKGYCRREPAIMSEVVLTGNSDSSTVETDTEDDEDIWNASTSSTSEVEGKDE